MSEKNVFNLLMPKNSKPRKSETKADKQKAKEWLKKLEQKKKRIREDVIKKLNKK